MSDEPSGQVKEQPKSVGGMTPGQPKLEVPALPAGVKGTAGQPKPAAASVKKSQGFRVPFFKKKQPAAGGGDKPADKFADRPAGGVPDKSAQLAALAAEKAKAGKGDHHLHLPKPAHWLVMVGLVAGAIGLASLVISMSGVAINISDLGKAPTPTPTATITPVPPTPTPLVMEPTLSPKERVQVGEFEFDQDGDAIPDAVESALGYDPAANDCVRQVGCGQFPSLPRAQLRINVVFLLDASASMNGLLGTASKWESASVALLNVMRSGFPSYTNVGLVTYGHTGGVALEQRTESCAGVEVLAELRPVNVGLIQEQVNQISPTGWTPLAGALQRAGQLMAGKEGEANFIIVLSDGQETCDGNPVAIAQALHESGVEVTTSVVGLDVSDQERTQLERIATAGGGGYFPASSEIELRQSVYLSAETVRLWEQINQCIVENLSRYGACINVQYLQSINFVKDLRFELQEEAAVLGKPFFPKPFMELEERMWSKFRQFREENWRQYDEDLEKLKLGQ